MSQQKQRKQIYLGWRLHGRIVARFALCWALYHVIVFQALCGRDFLVYESSVITGQQQVGIDEFLRGFVSQHVWVFLLAIAAFPLMLWEIVRLTHRFVGPLKRLESDLLRMAAGEEIRSIKFREADFAGGVEEAFNKFLASRHASNATTAQPAPRANESVRPTPSGSALPERFASLGADEFDSLLHESRTESSSRA